MSLVSTPTVRLKVQQVENTCLFELVWGDGMQISAQVSAPDSVYRCYSEWQRAYLSFYKTASLALSTPIQPPTAVSGSSSAANSAAHAGIDSSGTKLRGRAVGAGKALVTPQTRHSKLIQAEAVLRYEFQTWLRSAQLYEIRATLAAIAQSLPSLSEEADPTLTLFLCCSPLPLARLPWETWEMGTEFATAHALRIVRSPANIRKPTASSGGDRRKPRILAILGDDTGLSFQADQDAVQSLARLAEVTFVGWQPGQTATEVKANICHALTDSLGWDVLFFAGHSNETQMTGGELAIAPNTSISLKDLTPFLATAQANGLQFALFNSCSGLNIAESLIDLGFSQVAVMREPVHNRVAQEFLVKFFHGLAVHEDVQSALQSASQFLESEKSFDFPSAYLVPSLFCHPGATLFRIPPAGWRQMLLRAMPRRYEAIALVGCLALAWITPLQNWMLDQRISVQARYRVMTQQIPAESPPPVALVQIDAPSIQRRGIDGNEINPMRRDYLADILDAMVAKNADVIGIDYLLDNLQNDNDPLLAASVQAAVAQDTWLAFASIRRGQQDVGVSSKTQITHPAWTLEGNINVYRHILSIPNPNQSCQQRCPFGYLLTLIQQLGQHAPDQVPSPAAWLAEFPPQEVWTEEAIAKLDGPNAPPELIEALVDQVEQASQENRDIAKLQQFRNSPVSVWFANHLGRLWLLPVMDYSIPPSQVYVRIPAWALLEPDSLDTPIAVYDLDLSEQVVILGSNYPQAGIEGEAQKTDWFPKPRGYAYWFRRGDTPYLPGLPEAETKPPNHITGAELHAYNVHHLMTHHKIIAVPAFWMVAIAALVGKGVAFRLRRWNVSTAASGSTPLNRPFNRSLNQTPNQPPQSLSSDLTLGPGSAASRTKRAIAPLKLFLPQTVLQSPHKQRQIRVIGATSVAVAGYGLAALQLYISAQVVLPWLLPSIVICAYVLPAIRRKRS